MNGTCTASLYLLLKGLCETEREREREGGREIRGTGERQTEENGEKVHIPQVDAHAAMRKILLFAFSEEDKR